MCQSTFIPALRTFKDLNTCHSGKIIFSLTLLNLINNFSISFKWFKAWFFKYVQIFLWVSVPDSQLKNAIPQKVASKNRANASSPFLSRNGISLGCLAIRKKDWRNKKPVWLLPKLNNTLLSQGLPLKDTITCMLQNMVKNTI